MKAIRRFTVRIVLPQPIAALGDLATNLHWSWHPPTRDLFALIDPEIWQLVHRDPVKLLGEVSSERLTELAADPDFVAKVQAAGRELDEYMTGDRWYQRLTADRPASIAYFSSEFGITQALPQYSGGLGILAGDHLKAASDIGVPIIGVGLFYRAGYFRQSLSSEGWQQETYPVLDPDGLPLVVLREDDGTPVRVELMLSEGPLVARVRKAQVGRVPLLLLDTQVEENTPAMRDVTDRLYGGGTDHRLRQELLLGIGGVRAIRAFCRLTGHAAPEVFHCNEGHAGFLGVERIRELIEGKGLTFAEALEAVRAGTVFTTHTPVPAGIDRFPRDLVRAEMAAGPSITAIPVDEVLALGAETFDGGDPYVFNMAVMGLRLGQRANGVSKLHGAVSREMFGGLWPGFDVDDVPITSITNGVHAPTWVAAEAEDLVCQAIGSDLVNDEPGWDDVHQITDAELWARKRTMREALVKEARRRMRESSRERGTNDVELSWVEKVLDPDVLTIGFARRVPSYKRLTLMLRDPERLTALLTDKKRPVQIVVAGKAHPDDEGGKRLIQEFVEFADDLGVRNRIMFLPDYDIGMALFLYPGCDVWLNNPLRPLEACGTSGMKAALNGALNLSIRDGWWDEWFDGNNGWAIPTADGITDPERRDDLEAAALYDLIEENVTARFYEKGPGGLPNRWIEMVRHTLDSLGPKVLASRMVRDYVTQLYEPAAISSRAAAADDFALAKDLARWKHRVRAGWWRVAVEHVEAADVGDDPQLGSRVAVHSMVTLGDLEPDDVAVQLIFGRVDIDDRLVKTDKVRLTPAEQDGDGRWKFVGEVSLDRTGPFGYTVRAVPFHIGLASDAEMGIQAQPVSPQDLH
ncbi:MAG: alpha-glucan family phosphorylase [Actinomycetes bacterium]